MKARKSSSSEDTKLSGPARRLMLTEPSKRPKTILEDSKKIEQRHKPALGDIPVRKLTTAMLERLYLYWSQGLSPMSVKIVACR